MRAFFSDGMRFIRRWGAGFAFVLLWGYASPAPAFFGLFDGASKVVPQNGVVRVDVSGLKAGQAEFYKLDQDGVSIRFFLTRDAKNGLHAALDACDVCWKEGKGYKLGENAMICVNCGMKFPLARLGQKHGGCNPHHINVSEEGGKAFVSADELLAGSRFFTGGRP